MQRERFTWNWSDYHGEAVAAGVALPPMCQCPKCRLTVSDYGYSVPRSTASAVSNEVEKTDTASEAA